MHDMILCSGCGELFSLPSPYDKVRKEAYCGHCYGKELDALRRAGEIAAKLVAATHELEDMYPEMDFLLGAEVREIDNLLKEAKSGE